eukprot:CAMPEP_0114126780 /NCGR_PEP_ID=MMETSP0043_2-20121206/10011_1 /TAXON_ID=464988 /ORGANISM="Hemiselmis andersenii, Strain CCMP644" /LENGTH=174 /DNA_ID=CAMNT_0001219785 /DNA_START=550 /DNA_END=1071 /DNA_ORIENTATION=-
MPPSTAQRSLIRRFFLTWPAIRTTRAPPSTEKNERNDNRSEAGRQLNAKKRQQRQHHRFSPPSCTHLPHRGTQPVLLASRLATSARNRERSAPPRPKTTTNDESDKHDGTTAATMLKRQQRRHQRWRWLALLLPRTTLDLLHRPLTFLPASLHDSSFCTQPRALRSSSPENDNQ